EAVERLKQLAYRLVPALREAEVERCWAGLRPGNPDGKPVLGPVPGFTNLFVAAGHFRTGIHLSPITGKLIADLLTGRTPELPWQPFSLERFRRSA
ncbi:MAG: FAD-dependent oxidoreductase, partial [Gemmatales bacterium]|nr:FAD-dependent oxidoreductase [Gemmatales bacterium]MDW8387348.1 FAD-dependent oxidoreductase [Gemmatales bacterium]